MKKNIILASGSPRRLDMLVNKGYRPKVISPDVEENIPENLSVEETVMYLALKKALHVESMSEEGIIIAADTVVYNQKIIGKPTDFQDAFDILKSLSGTTHYVVSGVAIIDTAQNKKIIFSEVTEIKTKEYDDKAIIDYIEIGECWDKSGSYSIQGEFKKHIESYKGDYNNVIGFPIDRIEKVLSGL